MLIIDDSADPSDLRPGASGSCVIRRMFTDFNLIPKSLATLTTWECLGILEKLNMRQQTQETRCFKRFVWHWLHINQTTKRTKCFLVKIRLYGSRWNTISSDPPPPRKNAIHEFQRCPESSPGPPSFSNLTRRSKEKLHKHTQDSHVSHVYSPLPGIV